MLNRVYIGLGAALLVLYAVTAFNGWELPASKSAAAPSGVRQSPGGYRSFWYSGFLGGK